MRVDVEGRVLRLTNLDKVLYPDGTTKGEVLDYYARIAPRLLPGLAGRAVTRIRWPHGVTGQSFFEKNVPARTPSWIRTVEVPTSGTRSGKGEGVIRFPVVDSLASLTWMVNLAALELHVHQWSVDEEGRLLPPDRLVVDLDPGSPAGLGECAEVALLVRERLAVEGLACWPVTSGSKGLHLYVDLPDDVSWGGSSDDVRDFAHGIADDLQRQHPKLITSSMNKRRRRGKVFLDWSQNAGSKTTIAPYSLRGRERPTVAAPRTWDEVEAGAEDPLELDQLRFTDVLDRADD